MHFRHVYTRLLGSDIMSNWLSHKECPYEDCGSTDAFSYNLESCSGRCHSCERVYPRTKDTKFEWASETYPVMGQEQEKDDWDMNQQQQTNIRQHTHVSLIESLPPPKSCRRASRPPNLGFCWIHARRRDTDGLHL